MNTYYSTLRPVGPGTYPKGMKGFKNYNRRIYIPRINHEAWGELYYDRELTRQEMESHDLLPHPENFSRTETDQEGNGKLRPDPAS